MRRQSARAISLTLRSTISAASLLLAALVCVLADDAAAQTYCGGQEAALCPGYPGATCTVSGTKSIGNNCLLDFGTTAVTVTGTMQSAVVGGSFTIHAGALTLNQGKLRANGDGSTTAGNLTVSVNNDFVMMGTGVLMEAHAGAGGGAIDVSAGGVIDMQKGTLDVDGSGGVTCGEGGSITLAAGGTVTLAGSLISRAGGTSASDCSGGSIDVSGSDVTLPSAGSIDDSGGDVSFSSITLTAATGNVSVAGTIKGIGSRGADDPDSAGSGVDITLTAEEGDVSVTGTITATGSAPDGTGGALTVEAADQVTMGGTTTLNGQGDGGAVSVSGLSATVSGSVISRGESGGSGGTIGVTACTVTVTSSGKLDAGAASGGAAGKNTVSGGSITIQASAKLLATPCTAGGCNELRVTSGSPSISPSATIDPGATIIVDPNLHPCCGNGIVDVGEQCDQGNNLFCDGCTPHCTLENPACPDDGNLCTAEVCLANIGCTHPTITCPQNDGILCTDECQPAVGCINPNPNNANCDDQNTCTTDVCDPPNGNASGCVYTNVPDGQSCTDASACTVGNTCQAGICGTTVCCDDADPCTTDSCDPLRSCRHVESSELCPLGCAGQPAGTPCTDGDQATIGDTCNGSGTCVPGPGPNCNDVNVCTLDVAVGRDCLHFPWSTCVLSCAGQANGMVCIDQFNPCNQGVCSGGACAYQPYNCSDGNPANGEEMCINDNPFSGLDLGCVQTEPPANCFTCGDGNLDPGEQCDDGNTTSGDCCSSSCQLEASGSTCTSDGNLCTDDVCNATGTCTHPFNTAPCEDGNGCTVNDTCGGGTCQPGGPKNCADSNVCTDDTCSAPSGTCQHTNNTASCSDGNGCTVNDTCSGGTCQPGGPKNCDDSNVCTDDSCSAPSGTCQHSNNTASCDDGRLCTTGDVCSGGVCGGACQVGIPCGPNCSASMTCQQVGSTCTCQ